MKTGLLIIDPQNDFMDNACAALPVRGAVEDMARLADWIDRHGDALDFVMVTMDTHGRYDIGHASFWIDANGVPPAPYTEITLDDLQSGRVKTLDPLLNDRMLRYAAQVSENGRQPIRVWPDHCIKGTAGWQVEAGIAEALARRKARTGKGWVVVEKGAHPYAEFFSPFEAEAYDPDFPVTGVNAEIMRQLSDVDRLFVAGEALSHCVGAALESLRTSRSGGLEGVVLLEDCASPVVTPVVDFSPLAAEMIQKFKVSGLQIQRTLQD